MGCHQYGESVRKNDVRQVVTAFQELRTACRTALYGIGVH